MELLKANLILRDCGPESSIDLAITKDIEAPLKKVLAVADLQWFQLECRR